MKATYLIIGILIGGSLSFFLTRNFYHTPVPTAVETVKHPEADTSHSTTRWNWSDTLDAIKIAPNSHKIVYEDSIVRILQVVLEPNSTEPVHTHQWRSVMWFTQATPMIYYKYGFTGNKLIVQDSIQIPQMPAEVLNHGDILDPEEPHAIRNVSKQPGIAYRVEFKKAFKP